MRALEKNELINTEGGVWLAVVALGMCLGAVVGLAARAVRENKGEIQAWENAKAKHFNNNILPPHVK